MWLRLRSYEPIAVAAARNEAAEAAAEERRRSGTEDSGVFTRGGSEVAFETVEETSRDGSVRTSNRSAREQRYNELLRTAPPAAPAAAETKPSLFDRVVSPIATALGMQPKPKPQPAAASQPMQRAAIERQASPNPARQNPSGSGEGETPRGGAEEDDPDTDVSPPQLLAAQFQPVEVHDGEETVFAAVVNDNRSGVRSVSGVIASPSGSMQGFACTRESPETNRFIARIVIPNDAPAGVWIVKYLTLTDQASNSVNLSSAQGGLPPSASFRVTSADADATGPQLKSVWLDKQAMRAGERNTVFVQADDDKSGVSLVSGVFVSPAKSARVGFGCRSGGSGTWECVISMPVCLDCGTWRLEQLQLQDKANNLATFRNDNELVSRTLLDIIGD
ncbi:MAG TPA: hypothetical protein VF911_12680, partial [Thermoanaerobaculia bacterium]